MASTGAQLVSVSRKYRNGDATWDEVMAAAKKHKPTYDAAEVSDDKIDDKFGKTEVQGELLKLYTRGLRLQQPGEDLNEAQKVFSENRPCQTYSYSVSTMVNDDESERTEGNWKNVVMPPKTNLVPTIKVVTKHFNKEWQIRNNYYKITLYLYDHCIDSVFSDIERQIPK